MSRVEEATANSSACTPLYWTSVARSNFSPVTNTEVGTKPRIGATEKVRRIALAFTTRRSSIVRHRFDFEDSELSELAGVLASLLHCLHHRLDVLLERIKVVELRRPLSDVLACGVKNVPGRALLDGVDLLLDEMVQGQGRRSLVDLDTADEGVGRVKNLPEGLIGAHACGSLMTPLKPLSSSN